MTDSKKRSMIKSIIWRIFGVLILGAITYLITGSAKEMTQVTLTYIGIKHITYILNEYVWNKK